MKSILHIAIIAVVYIVHVHSIAISSRISYVPTIITDKPPSTITDRAPFAVLNSLQVSIQSFFSNTAIMIPLCLIAGAFHKHPTRSIWWTKSLTSGLEWGMIASVFSGGEELLKILRDKDDIWNRSLASGLASGLVQMREDGVKGLVVGFAQGFGFLFVLDRLATFEPPVSAQSSSMKTAANKSTKSSLTKTSTVSRTNKTSPKVVKNKPKAKTNK